MNLEIIENAFKAIKRASTLLGCAAALTLLACPATAGMTQEEIDAAMVKFKGASMTVVHWGGTGQDAARAAFFKPFAEKYGVTLVEDSPPTNPKLMAMVNSGNVTWDVIDIGAFNVGAMGKAGFLEELDYSVVSDEGVLPGFAQPWGIGGLSYSEVPVYRTDTYEGDSGPKSIVDFFDIEKFPGKRGMRKHPISNLAFALVADGVAIDDVYPITEEKLERAYKKLDTIKDHVIWWEQGAQPAQLLTTGEVVMTTAWNGRVDELPAAGYPTKLVWNGGQLIGDAWAIPKGSKNVEMANLFIAWATLPKNNARLSEFITYGPVTVEGLNYVPEDRKALIPTTYQDVQIICDFEWWGENLGPQVERFNEWVIQ